MPNPNTPTNTINRGYFFAFLSAVILSTTGILIRYLTQNYHLPALILALWRELFVVLSLLLVLSIFRPHLLKLPRTYLPFMVVYGFVLALFNSSWTLSVSLNGAAVATVMSYSSAAFTAILAWWFLKENLGMGKIAAVILSLAGCLLVSGAIYATEWQANLMGIFTGILSGLCYAVYSLMGRTVTQCGLNPWTMLLYTFAFAAVFLLGFNLFSGGVLPGTAARGNSLLWPDLSGVGWIILFVLAAGPTLMGYGTYNLSLTYLPSSVANLIVTLEPVFTTIIAYLVFDEVLTLIQFIGGLMIVGGVVVIRLTEGLKTAANGTSEMNPAA